MNFNRSINKQNKNNCIFLAYTIYFLLLLLTLSFVTSEGIKKTLAMPIMGLDSNMKAIKTNTTNVTTSLIEKNIGNSNKTQIAESSFYKAKGKTIENASTTFPSFNQTAVIVVEKGSINGIGNITNFESWIFPSISPTNTLGFGHGVITSTDNQMISWIGYDKHSITEKNGTTIFQGDIFFNKSRSMGSISSLNNIKGIYITKEYSGTNGNEQTTKMWKTR